ncbi:phosphatidylglycerophosphatase A family protein [Propionivibrio limicola]|uniref:phosphatidylglycerophosphatase A family protein n=1 Tax=Propionivibrio limicola TaxID=167645 RepID=UPI001FEACADB|nr:phosphatidylglycerophosphatase A [Propionivibrio limicola]
MDRTIGKSPSLRFLFSHPAHLVACGFGSGLSPVAPGTAGTLFAWATFLLAQPWLEQLSRSGQLALLAACFVIGVLAVHKTGRDLGEPDHGSIVWDEIVPFWLVLLFCPAGWYWQTAAFLLFRLFDIVKPQPARFFDERVKNGFGVMTDDVFAAAYTLLTLIFIGHFLT